MKHFKIGFVVFSRLKSSQVSQILVAVVLCSPVTFKIPLRRPLWLNPKILLSHICQFYSSTQKAEFWTALISDMLSSDLIAHHATS